MNCHSFWLRVWKLIQSQVRCFLLKFFHKIPNVFRSFSGPWKKISNSRSFLGIPGVVSTKGGVFVRFSWGRKRILKQQRQQWNYWKCLNAVDTSKIFGRDINKKFTGLLLFAKRNSRTILGLSRNLSSKSGNSSIHSRIFKDHAPNSMTLQSMSNPESIMG